MKITPCHLRYANDFVLKHHRHNKPVRGCKFCVAALADGGDVIGVAIVGRPIARYLDDGLTAEVLRCCVKPDAPRNANSFLYGRVWRIWQAMGGKAMVTYTLEKESGDSLRGADWKLIGRNKPQSWSVPSRPRQEQAIYSESKLRWRKEAQDAGK